MMLKGLLKNSFIRSSMLIILIAIAAICVFAVGGQVYVYFHPGYQNIMLDPDPVIGWKLSPNIEFINTGDHWYANELSVHHKINSLGFTGPDRNQQKPEHTLRVALMGDSFVEALQVPWEKSAAGVLERALSKDLKKRETPYNNFEAMNFGLSNISVGQYLLIWEQYAKYFSPDYVFIFLSGVQLERTDQRKADWGIAISRPSFDIVRGQLKRYQVEGYDDSLRAFQEQIKIRGGRSQRRPQEIFITDWVESGEFNKTVKNLIPSQTRLALKQFVTSDDGTMQRFLPSLIEKVKVLLKPSSIQDKAQEEIENQADGLELEIKEKTLEVNFRVIEELAKKVRASGGELIIVDASLYFWFTGANEVLTERIYQFAQDKDYPYIPLYKDLLSTDRKNIWARFPHSYHFNEHGNVIFAKNMLDWIKKDIL